ncbi:hypothetical protein BRD08_09190 [Halobacteriales archaeon SW_10_66_29]|nr:MAG: hypothetical protein BRD08_09190 [Halobacteriales archaeon SW_10_66_29]
MSDDSKESVTVTLHLEKRTLEALRSIRQEQREQLASDSWGRQVAELSEEPDDRCIAQLLHRAYSRKLRRETQDQRGPTAPIGADNRCTPD